MFSRKNKNRLTHVDIVAINQTWQCISE
jgi:hypothetical protein